MKSKVASVKERYDAIRAIIAIMQRIERIIIDNLMTWWIFFIKIKLLFISITKIRKLNSLIDILYRYLLTRLRLLAS